MLFSLARFLVTKYCPLLFYSFCVNYVHLFLRWQWTWHRHTTPRWRVNSKKSVKKLLFIMSSVADCFRSVFQSIIWTCTSHPDQKGMCPTLVYQSSTERAEWLKQIHVHSPSIQSLGIHSLYIPSQWCSSKDHPPTRLAEETQPGDRVDYRVDWCLLLTKPTSTAGTEKLITALSHTAGDVYFQFHFIILIENFHMTYDID